MNQSARVRPPRLGRIGRPVGMLLLTVIYILAYFVAVAVFRLQGGALWLRLLLADVAATVAVFLFSVLLRNASVYDPYWSVQPPVILLSLVGPQTTLAGYLLIALVGLWAVRLTANFTYTFHGMAYQDWRYTTLAERTGRLYPLVNLAGIHLVPTLVVYLCTLPAAYVVATGIPFSPLCLIGGVMCLGAVVLQGVSDVQMHAYRKHRTTPFMETGLWRHSRHPNYLGEILMWWGVACFSLAARPTQPLWLVGAIANTLLFVCISIPLADGRQSRKEGFDSYRARTRALLPFPKPFFGPKK